MAVIQWYPGHIAKLERQLSNLLKQIDIVVEVIDARIPNATTNPRLRQKYYQEGSVRKPLLVLINKADLGDPDVNRRWLNHLKQQQNKHLAVMLYESSTGKQKKRLVDIILQLGEDKMKTLEAKGLKRRPLRVAVVGMPNVGKSSFINSVVGRKKAQTGHKAGVTRQAQWVRIHPSIELLDTPGVIPPRLDSEEVGLLLASVNSVGEAVIQDEEVANFLVHHIDGLYPELLSKHYKLDLQEELTLSAIASHRHYVEGGGVPDLLRAAQSVLSDFRHGRFGRLTLERVQDNG